MVMNADERRYFDSLTERVLGGIFEVANTLGAGFLERVYERALLKVLSTLGIADARTNTCPKNDIHKFYANVLSVT